MEGTTSLRHVGYMTVLTGILACDLGIPAPATEVPPTPTPVTGDVAVFACSSYNDQGFCEANGCNWNLAPGIVPLFSCQNP